MNLTASDRTTLIKLASSLPKEDATRKAILAGLKVASSTYEVEPAFDSAEDKKSFFDAAKKMGLPLKEVGGKGPLHPLIAVTGDPAKVKKFLIQEMMNGKDPGNEVDDMMEIGKTAYQMSKKAYGNKELQDLILDILHDEGGDIRLRSLLDLLKADGFSLDDIDEALSYLCDLGKIDNDDRTVSKTAYQMSKKAHRPTLSGITLAAYREGNAKMMYFIDAVKNHSKFYEILIEEDANGGFVLRRRWGALTDNGAGRVDAKDADGLTLGQAKALMAGLVREKMGKGYQDAFKSQPVGQYPVGLSRTVGFNWGTQEITKSVPALRELLQDLQYAIEETEEGSVEGLTVALAEVSRAMSDLPSSSMAREIETRLKGPLSRLLGHPRFIPSPDKIIAELISLKNYIAKQLQTSNV